MPLGTEVDLGLRDIVLDVDPATPEKRHTHPHPIFGPCLLWPRVGRIKMPLGTEVNVGPDDVVLDVVALLPETGHNPQFSVHVYCGQTAEWMKTPLGTEIDLGPGHIVLDGVPAPTKRAPQAPYFWPMFIVAMVTHLSYC